MYQYQNLLCEVLRDGEERKDRTGVGTKAVFNKHMTFRMDGTYMPIVTLKETKIQAPLGELAAFIRGSTDNAVLAQYGCNYWAHNLNADYWDNSPYKRHSTDLGKLGYSYTLRNFEGVDQLRKIMKLAWDKPHDRRLLVSHWHPKDMEESVLPPCHYAWQIYCHGEDNEYVSLVWTQRSVDILLGLPADFIYYSALLICIANELGRKPYDVSCNLGDVHIYNNHLDTARELAYNGIVFDPPKYKFTGMDYQRVEEFTPDMIELINYKHGAFIPLKMAV